MSQTGFVLLSLVIALAIYDLYAVTTGGLRMTESWFIRQQAEQHPFLLIAFGYLCGHFFSGMTPDK